MDGEHTNLVDIPDLFHLLSAKAEQEHSKNDRSCCAVDFDGYWGPGSFDIVLLRLCAVLLPILCIFPPTANRMCGVVGQYDPQFAK